MTKPQVLSKTRTIPDKAMRILGPSLYKKRVFIVDDHPIFQKGLTQLIDSEVDLLVGGHATEPQEALQALQKSRFDLAIVDLSLEDGNGLELVKMLKDRLPKLPILILSAHDESLYAERSLHAGARGYIMKREAVEKLLGAIRQILRGEIYVSEPLKLKMLEKLTVHPTPAGTSPVECLSDRELEVFQLIGQGLKTRQIADRLCVSFKTVDAYRTRIKEKLSLENAARLVHSAIQWGQETDRLFPSRLARKAS